MSVFKTIFWSCRRNLNPVSLNFMKLQYLPVARFLYADAAIGLDLYAKVRDKTKTQFINMEENYKSKMIEYAEEGSNNMIFTEDLKNMLHLVESSPEDMELIVKMIRKFYTQNQQMRFGNFIFGPVVMRTLHHLNQPETALSLFKDPSLLGFFDQLVSFQILLELLFRNQMYQEMLEVYDVIKKSQVKNIKHPKNSLVLVMAACYKNNSPEFYKYAMDVWKDVQETGILPPRRATTFAAALAMNQNAPHVGLEIISHVKNQNYVTIRNIKIMALSDIGRPEDALPVIRYSVETDLPYESQTTTTTFCQEAIEKVKEAIEKSGNKEAKNDFERLEKQLRELNMISKDTLDMLLCSEIAPIPENQFQQRTILSSSFGRQRFPPRRNLRPGLQHLD